MESKMTSLLALLMAILVSVTATAADRESPGRYLIVAKPVGVQFVRYGDDPGAVVSPSFYKLKIKDARVVQEGPSKLMPATMTLEIRANNGDAILDYDQVYLLARCVRFE